MNTLKVIQFKWWLLIICVTFYIKSYLKKIELYLFIDLIKTFKVSIIVLDMTLNCILVYDSITERFFRTPGP